MARNSGVALAQCVIGGLIIGIFIIAIGGIVLGVSRVTTLRIVSFTFFGIGGLIFVTCVVSGVFRYYKSKEQVKLNSQQVAQVR